MPDPRQEYQDFLRILGPQPRILGGMPLAPTSGAGVLMDVLAGLPQEWKNNSSGAQWAMIPTRRNLREFNQLVRYFAQQYDKLPGVKKLPQSIREAMAFFSVRHPYFTERLAGIATDNLNPKRPPVMDDGRFLLNNAHFEPWTPTKKIRVTPRDRGTGVASGMGPRGQIQREVGYIVLDPNTPYNQTTENAVNALTHESLHGAQQARYPRAVKAFEKQLAALDKAYRLGALTTDEAYDLYRRLPHERSARQAGARGMQEYWAWQDLMKRRPTKQTETLRRQILLDAEK